MHLGLGIASVVYWEYHRYCSGIVSFIIAEIVSLYLGEYWLYQCYWRWDNIVLEKGLVEYRVGWLYYSCEWWSWLVPYTKARWLSGAVS